MAQVPASSRGGSTALTFTAVTGGVGFTNGWADLGGDGLVYLRGAADATGASGDGMFTLPAAYRPSVKRILVSFAGGVTTANLGNFEVLTTGVVSCFSRTNAVNFSLDGIAFSL